VAHFNAGAQTVAWPKLWRSRVSFVMDISRGRYSIIIVATSRSEEHNTSFKLIQFATVCSPLQVDSLLP